MGMYHFVVCVKHVAIRSLYPMFKIDLLQLVLCTGNVTSFKFSPSFGSAFDDVTTFQTGVSRRTSCGHTASDTYARRIAVQSRFSAKVSPVYRYGSSISYRCISPNINLNRIVGPTHLPYLLHVWLLTHEWARNLYVLLRWWCRCGKLFHCKNMPFSDKSTVLIRTNQSQIEKKNHCNVLGLLHAYVYGTMYRY